MILVLFPHFTGAETEPNEKLCDRCACEPYLCDCSEEPGLQAGLPDFKAHTSYHMALLPFTGSANGTLRNVLGSICIKQKNVQPRSLITVRLVSESVI